MKEKIEAMCPLITLGASFSLSFLLRLLQTDWTEGEGARMSHQNEKAETSLERESQIQIPEQTQG